MIDFNTSQLTWIVIAACSAGGGGYMTMNDNVKSIDAKIQVTQVKVEDTNDRVADLQKQLTRMEDKLDRKQGSK